MRSSFVGATGVRIPHRSPPRFDECPAINLATGAGRRTSCLACMAYRPVDAVLQRHGFRFRLRAAGQVGPSDDCGRPNLTLAAVRCEGPLLGRKQAWPHSLADAPSTARWPVPRTPWCFFLGRPVADQGLVLIGARAIASRLRRLLLQRFLDGLPRGCRARGRLGHGVEDSRRWGCRFGDRRQRRLAGLGQCRCLPQVQCHSDIIQ